MASLSHSIKRGSAELAILMVLKDQPLHGYEIARRIEQDTAGVLHFTLASLYPTHDAYVKAIRTAARKAVNAGFVIRIDATAIKAAAAASNVGG